jgi:hypothetical protein
MSDSLVVQIKVSSIGNLTPTQVAELVDRLIAIGQQDAIDSKESNDDDEDSLAELDEIGDLEFEPAQVSVDVGVAQFPAVCTNFVGRARNVLEDVYGQLATDSDLETVTAPQKYKTLTNMTAALLDELGSSQISFARRYDYQDEARRSNWAGTITPVI